MQRYSGGDPYERQPLEGSHEFNDASPSRRLAGDAYHDNFSHTNPIYYDSPSLRLPQQSYAPQEMPQPPQHDQYRSYQPSHVQHDSFMSSSGSYRDDHMQDDHMHGDPAPPSPPPPPPHRALSRNSGSLLYADHVAQSNSMTGEDNRSEHAASAMAALSYDDADQNDQESEVVAEVLRGGTRPLPPPPSRAQYPTSSTSAYQTSLPGGYASDAGFGRDSAPRQLPEPGSRTSVNPFGTPSTTQSPTRSMQSFATEQYVDDPYQGLSATSNRLHDASLGVVNPHEIVDDGDDGLHYGKHSQRTSQRTSVMSLSQSDRPRQVVSPAAAISGAAAVAGGLPGRSGHARSDGDNADFDREKSSTYMSSTSGVRSKKWKWLVIILVFLLVAGAIIGGVVGSIISGNKKNYGSDKQTASDDHKKNGDLDINSPEIKALLNNKDLHKVFPGMDYTPLNTQYPDCIHNPPSQNNVTRDLAVLSQLTNKIRLYGTDCNQTQMLIHAIDRLDMKKDVKIWMGVWLDKNETTNARQLAQMWDILDQHGAEPFEGVIVANEVLFRKDMTVTQLGTVLDGVRSNFSTKGIKLPVASSDLGDDWTAGLAAESDYVMANIHPFFAGTAADAAADWTYDFWTSQDKQFWKADKSKNIISETGWPTGGGKNCGQSPVCTSSTPGAVASIDGVNTFMENWVCQALANGTQYFWFEAFDEPWKVRYNEGNKNWEDKWGLLDMNRKLKPGIKIPDCGGKTV
ncbi:hypothetical protein E4U42_006996 [Claviceps africana]|uniref:glucan endo-1,3-beta-D-glucosidase n=1 Tax=Claviceps africana TaxID=83212 RepID=A0A8K0NGE5_9HYPO|nr:hypothetical protein E4U42_006996 [Claviceps africana]